MNRRHALALIAALPFAARLEADTRPSAKTRVVLGRAHGFLIEPDGTMQSWSTSEHPEGAAPDWLGLGHNRPLPKYTLGPVHGLTNVVAAAAGWECSFAVLSDGRVMAWGLNAGSGRLGTTSRATFEKTASWGANSNTPVPVVTKFDAIDIACIMEHVVALARDGSVYTWGKADKGQLGIGPLPKFDFQRYESSASTYVPFPVRVPNLADIVAISTGYNHSLALRRDGTVLAWGENSMGQLGDGTTMDRDRPVVVQGVRTAVAIAAASRASAAVLADGTVMNWGAVAEEVPAPIPSRVSGVSGARAIAGGVAHFAALTNTGTVMTWGHNLFSALGRGGRAQGAGPARGLSGVQSISVGARTTAAVLPSGRIMTWGAVRPWARPDADGLPGESSSPILLWLDGLEQP